MAKLPPGWKLPQEQAKPEAPEKAPEEMSDDELDTAVREAREKLLTAQRDELRARKRSEPPAEGEGRRSFAEFVRSRPYYR